MQVQNFECQIAKAQIARYVAGDALGGDTIADLEKHISKCPDCKQNLAERRTALQAMIAPETEAPANLQEKPTLRQLLKARKEQTQPIHAAVRLESPQPSSFWKPTVYCLALGAVLIGMSYLSRNLGSVLGAKAASTTKPVAAPVSASAKEFPAPVEDGTAFQGAEATAEFMAARLEPAPKPVLDESPKQPPRPATRPHSHRTHRKAVRAADGGTVRVYAPSN